MGNPKHRHSKRRPAVLLLLVVIAYSALVYRQPFNTVKPVINFQGVNTTAQPDNLLWPGYGEAAIGAIGYGVLRTYDNQKPLPTASIAKVITALAVLRQRPLAAGQSGPTITINQADVASYQKYVGQDGSVVAVSLGEQLSEYQALQALLLPSANNMAETLARWAFGSIDSYNSYANNYAHGLGLDSVTVTDPSGFLPTTVASAQDLTTLGELALQQPLIAEIVAQPTATIPVQGAIRNYNFLVGQDGNIGIKTGNNDQDQGAYLFAFRKPVGQTSVLIVGAIMGGPDLLTVQRDAQKLVTSAASRFQQTTFVRRGDSIASYQPAGRPAVNAIAGSDLSLVTWNGYAFTTKTTLQALAGNQPVGTTVGSITVSDGPKHTKNSVPVVLQTNLPAPSLQHRLTRVW